MKDGKRGEKRMEKKPRNIQIFYQSSYLNAIHTVSVVLSKRSESRNHVITAGGREPAL
jgi:hypothetical protein